MLSFIDSDQDYYVIHEKSMYGNQNCFFYWPSVNTYQLLSLSGPLPTAINL